MSPKFRTAGGQFRHPTALQQADPIRQDVEPKLDLLPVDGAIGQRVPGDPFVQACELGDGLAGEPCSVVAGNPLERVLALHDEPGSVGGRQHQDETCRGEERPEDPVEPATAAVHPQDAPYRLGHVSGSEDAISAHPDAQPARRSASRTADA